MWTQKKHIASFSSAALPDENKKINRKSLDLFVPSRTEPHMACPSILSACGMKEDCISACRFTITIPRRMKRLKILLVPSYLNGPSKCTWEQHIRSLRFGAQEVFSQEIRTKMLAILECGHPRSMSYGYRYTKEFLVGLPLPFQQLWERGCCHFSPCEVFKVWWHPSPFSGL